MAAGSNVNQIPVLRGLPTSLSIGRTTIQEPHRLAPDVSFVDSDFTGGSITVSGLANGDVVALANDGTVSVDTGTVSVNGTVVGFVAGFVGSTFSIHLNQGTTAAIVETLIEHLTYHNVSDAPTATRDLNIVVADGQGANTQGPAAAIFSTTALQNIPLGNVAVAPWWQDQGYDYEGAISAPAFGDFSIYDAIVGVAVGPLIPFFRNGRVNNGSPEYAQAAWQNPSLWNFNSSIIVTPDIAKPSFGDIDGNGRPDLIVGTGAGRLSVVYSNAGSTLHGAAHPFASIQGSNLAPALIDLTGDGRADLVLGASDGRLRTFVNEGSSSRELTGGNNPFNGVDVGEHATPTAVDLDSDGDLDIVVGSAEGTFRAFYNQGDRTFVERTGTSNPFYGIDVGKGSAPAFVDIDGDGRLDLVSGTNDGVLLTYRNITDTSLRVTIDANETPKLVGLPSTLTFGEHSTKAAPQILFPQVEFKDADFRHGSIVVTGLHDDDRVSLQTGENVLIDGGTLFVAGVRVGTVSGGVGTPFKIFLDTASSETRVTTLIQHLTYQSSLDTSATERTLRITIADEAGASTRDSTSVFVTTADADGPIAALTGVVGAPAFGDVDGDGNLDLLVGTSDGKLRYFLGHADNSFSERTGAGNPFGDLDVGEFSKPAIGDLNGDGRADVAVGSMAGELWIAYQDANGNFTIPSTPVPGIRLGWSAPAIGDLNNDGKNDMVLAGPNGALHWYSDVAGRGFVEGLDNPLADIKLSPGQKYQIPVLVDYDQDGRQDVLITSSEFVSRLFRQKEEGTFVEVSSAMNPFRDLANFNLRYPTAADINRDGKIDYIVGSNDTTLRSYLNSGTQSGNVVIKLQSENDAPVLTNQIPSWTFDENTVNAGPLRLSNTFRLVDPDFKGGRLTVSGLLPEDEIVLLPDDLVKVLGTTISVGGRSVGTIIIAGNGSPYTIDFNDTATTTDVEAAAQRLGYANNSDTPTGTRTLKISVSDETVFGSTVSLANTSSVDIVVNINPQADSVGLSGLKTYFTFDENTLNAAPQRLDADVAFSAPDYLGGGLINVAIEGPDHRIGLATDGVVQLSSTGDVRVGGTLVGTAFGGFGTAFVIKLNAAARAGTIETLVEHLTYQNVSDLPAPLNAVILSIVTDPAATTAMRFTGSAPTTFLYGLGMAAPANLSTADVGRDGFSDLLTGTVDGHVGVLARGSFNNFIDLTGVNSIGKPNNPFVAINVGSNAAPAMGDMNGDGIADILVGAGDGTLHTYLGQSFGRFVEATGSSDPFQGLDVGENARPAFIDINRDGRPDVVIGNDIGMRLFTQDSTGHFVGQTGIANPFEAIFLGRRSFTFEDVNGDGRVDLVLGSGSTQSLELYLQNSSGRFAKAINADNPFSGLSVGTGATAAFMDVDADGDRDLVVKAVDGTLKAYSNAAITFADASLRTTQILGVEIAPQSDGSAPVLTFASSIVNAAGKASVPFTVSNLPADATAYVTVTPSATGGVPVQFVIPPYTPVGDLKLDLTDLRDGSVTVSIEVRDSQGASIFGGSKTLLIDTVAPVLSTQAPTLPVEATSAGGATVRLTDWVRVSESGPVTFKEGDKTVVSGQVFLIGSHTVTASATDAAGNKSVERSFDFTVADTTKPVIDLQTPPTQIKATSPAGAVVDFTGTSIDAIDGIGSVVFKSGGSVVTSGQIFAVGTYTIVASAMDAAGNAAASRSFTFTVEALPQLPTDPMPPVPVNSPPVLLGDGVIAIKQGASVALTRADLTASDVESPASALVYSVGTTQHGQVTVGGVSVTSFTQAQLDAGLVSFQHDGTVNDAVSFSVTVSDGTSVSAPKTVTASVDLTPTVSGITYGTNDGMLQLGETITFSVKLSENVMVTGTPSLTLNSGGEAIYQSGSGTDTLVFSHVVAAGQTTPDLAVVGLKFDNGSIRDLVGQNVGELPTSGINPDGIVVVEATPSQPPVTPTDPETPTPPTGGGGSGPTTPTDPVIPTPPTGGGGGDPTTPTIPKTPTNTVVLSTGGTASPGAGETLTVSGVTSGVLVIDGAGKVELTGTNTYTGPTEIKTGTLVVNGSIISPVSVGSGGTLGGSGSTGTVSVASGGALSPGNSPGILSTKDLSLAAGAALKQEIGGTASGRFDQLKVTGTVGLAGATLDVTAFGGFTSSRGDSFTIIDNDGTDAVTGNFAGLNEGGVLSFGARNLRISYHGGDGNDVTLTDTTGLAFQPEKFGTVVTSADGQVGAVYGLYEALLNRAPDAYGLSGFVSALESGASLTQVAQAILASPEHGSAQVSPAAYVESLYANLLNRSADASGLQTFTGALASGVSQATVAVQIATSAEAKAVMAPAFASGVFVADASEASVARLYYGLLDRAPDVGGLQSFSGFIENGGGGTAGEAARLGQAASSILSSAEYTGKHAGMSDAAFVFDLYHDALGRAPDAGGQATHLDALTHGASRAQVAIDITQSVEAQLHWQSVIHEGTLLVA